MNEDTVLSKKCSRCIYHDDTDDVCYQGHRTRPCDEFIEYIKCNDIDLEVDVDELPV